MGLLCRGLEGAQHRKRPHGGPRAERRLALPTMGALGKSKGLAEDSKRLEYGPGTIYTGVPSSLSFGVGGQFYS